MKRSPAKTSRTNRRRRASRGARRGASPALLVVAGLVLAGAIVVGRWVLTTTPSPTTKTPAAPAASTASQRRYDRPVIDRIHTRSGRQVHRGPKRQGHFVRQPRRRDLQRQDGVPEHRPGDDGARSSRGVSCEQSSVQRQRQRFCSDLGAHVLPATQQPGRRVLSHATPRRVCYVWFANRSIGYLLPPTDQGRGLSKARAISR